MQVCRYCVQHNFGKIVSKFVSERHLVRCTSAWPRLGVLRDRLLCTELRAGVLEGLFQPLLMLLKGIAKLEELLLAGEAQTLTYRFIVFCHSFLTMRCSSAHNLASQNQYDRLSFMLSPHRFNGALHWVRPMRRP